MTPKTMAEIRKEFRNVTVRTVLRRMEFLRETGFQIYKGRGFGGDPWKFFVIDPLTVVTASAAPVTAPKKAKPTKKAKLTKKPKPAKRVRPKAKAAPKVKPTKKPKERDLVAEYKAMGSPKAA